MDFHRLYAVVHDANTGSMRLMEKCGFVREGTWREASQMDGEYGDVHAYGILRREWEQT
jgi:RimJ/RimL family protein N-acetyltransferase